MHVLENHYEHVLIVQVINISKKAINDDDSIGHTCRLCDIVDLAASHIVMIVLVYSWKILRGEKVLPIS